MQLILSTCGTSLLTNLAGEQRKLVTQYANAKTAEAVPEADRASLQALIEKLDPTLEKDSPEDLAKASAELNGLIRLGGGRLPDASDLHWLVCTDTWLGEAAAHAIAGVLKRHGGNVEPRRITDLQTSDLAEFRLAMSELAQLCAEELTGYRHGGWRVVFNLTGGFKSVQGYMQALGMLYADESIYVFESGDQLLRLPRLPVELDAEAAVDRHKTEFRRLAVDLPVTAAEVSDDPGSLFMVVDNQATPTVWGKLIWHLVEPKLRSNELLLPLTPRLRFGDRFRDTLKGLSPDQLRQLNTRLDELARRLEDPQFNPARLDFKKLQVPRKGSTHECDAWAQSPAPRLFGHYEDEVFVVDRLDQGIGH